MPAGKSGYQPRTTPAERRAFFDLQRQINAIIATGGGGGSTFLTGAGPPNAGIGEPGDFYIDTTNDIIYGPKTAGGSWPVAMDPEGGGGGTSINEVYIGTTAPSDPAVELWYDTDAIGSGAGELGYVHQQSTVSAVWTIVHPLDFLPNVTVTDSAGDQVEGDVRYIGMTTVQLTFSSPFAGVAYLS